MNRVNWNGANYKDWVGLSAAPVFWIASLVCFVLGLAFKSGTGVLIPGTDLDIIVLFSIGLGFANTAIQIVGNDTDKEDMGMALFLMWGASYMLGIGSNVNFLYGVIGLNNASLQFLVCWGLGVMIEVAPERLLVKFLRSIGVLKTNSHPVRTKNQQNQGRQGGVEHSIRSESVPQQYQEQDNAPKSRFPEQLKQQSKREAAYHQISYRKGE